MKLFDPENKDVALRCWDRCWWRPWCMIVSAAAKPWSKIMIKRSSDRDWLIRDFLFFDVEAFHNIKFPGFPTSTSSRSSPISMRRRRGVRNRMLTLCASKTKGLSWARPYFDQLSGKLDWSVHRVVAVWAHRRRQIAITHDLWQWGYIFQWVCRSRSWTSFHFVSLGSDTGRV